MPDAVSNATIADALEELGDLYELDGAIVHRVLAYRNAARSVRDSPVSVAALARAGKATQLPGIGDTLQQKILTLLDTGTTPSSERLRAKFPPGLVAITRLPGLGPKRARMLHDELGIESLDQLREAALAQRLRDVRGLGPKFEANVLAALEAGATRAAPRLLLPAAIELGEALIAGLRADAPKDARIELAGSARRMVDAVKDIDLIATTTEPQALSGLLAGLEQIEGVSSAGAAGARAQTHSGTSVDLRVAAPEQYGNLLQHFTGSGRHNAALREDAVRRGLHVSEYGVLDDGDGTTHTCMSEQEVYGLLGLTWIAPELRENRGELEAAALDGSPATSGKASASTASGSGLPHLIELGDIRGDLHSHTIASDGRNTISEMAHAARERGYEYLAITDHSASHGFGNDVSPDRAAPPDRAHQGGERGDRGHRAAGGQRGQHPPGWLAGLRGRAARPTGLDRGERAHLLRHGRSRDDQAHGRGHRASAGGRHRTPHRPPDRAARALRGGPGGGVRGRGAHRHAAGDQRQP